MQSLMAWIRFPFDSFLSSPLTEKCSVHCYVQIYTQKVLILLTLFSCLLKRRIKCRMHNWMVCCECCIPLFLGVSLLNLCTKSVFCLKLHASWFYSRKSHLPDKDWYKASYTCPYLKELISRFLAPSLFPWWNLLRMGGEEGQVIQLGNLHTLLLSVTTSPANLFSAWQK